MPTSPLDEKITRGAIVDAIANGATDKWLAATWCVNESSIRRFKERHDIRSPLRVIEAKATVRIGDPVSREEMLEAELTDLKREVGKVRKTSVTDERVTRAIETAAANTPHVPTEMPQAPAEPVDAHHSQAVILSDWHAGETVDVEQMGGINEFNWDVLRERVAETHRSLLSFKKVRPTLTELQIWLLGDMVSGNIHDELKETNEFGVAEQAVKVGHLIADFISGLVPHYPRIKVVGIAGNHARTKKDHASKNVFDSLDVIAYELAASRLGIYQSVEFVIPRSAMHVQEIAGNNVLLWHGDGVRSSMPGVPWGGVMRRWNELRKAYQQRNVMLDGLAIGHFHQANAVTGIWMNGSLIGPNEYGLKNFGSGENPTQLLLTFDNEAGRLTDVSYITPTAGTPGSQGGTDA